MPQKTTEVNVIGVEFDFLSVRQIINSRKNASQANLFPFAK